MSRPPHDIRRTKHVGTDRGVGEKPTVLLLLEHWLIYCTAARRAWPSRPESFESSSCLTEGIRFNVTVRDRDRLSQQA